MRPNRRPLRGVVPATVLSLAGIVHAQPWSESEKAAKLLRDGKYGEAAELFGQLARANTFDGYAWSQWGYCLHAEKKYDEATLLSQRFYPDMFSFARQVQQCADHAKNCTALLAGVEAPKTDNTEKTIAELVARVDKTIAFLKSVNASQIDGTEAKAVVVKQGDREINFTGIDLLQNRSLPNFYFHATTAYDILRSNGVELGKRDIMGS